MTAPLGILLAYLLLTLLVGFLFRRAASRDRVEFFLAGRNISAPLMFFTMAATNFSAFTIFGLSGAGYRIGYAFYPIMGFGTGFMALTFYLVGVPIHRLSRRRGYITPSDFIGDRYRSPLLKRLFALLLTLLTLPYISIQAIAAGRSLHSLIGLPYLAGALLVTGFVVLYVALGGMYSVVWTDLLQALLMIGCALAAFWIIAARSGGFLQAQAQAYGSFPALFSRPGLDGSMLPGVWLGYLALWFFADPMFPQLFQRFSAARNERALKVTAVLYPLITTGLFFLTISIGVLGRTAFPDLSAADSESVFPLLLKRYTGAALGMLLFTGGLAALMSTLDSQLLTLTSLVSVDLLRLRGRRTLPERLVTAGLGLLGLLIALRPPGTILAFISRTSFNGFAVLAPAVIGGLYWKRAHRAGAAASLVVGELLVLVYALGLLPMAGTLPVVPILGLTTGVFVLVSLLARPRPEGAELVQPISPGAWKRAVPFLVLLLLGNDFWAWGRTPRFLAGLPLWVWYYFLLGGALALAFQLLLPAGRAAEGPASRRGPGR
jgi:SSS family solute:Na+ symporter